MKLILSSCDFRNPNSNNIIIKNLDKPISECCVLYFPNEKATYESIHSDLYFDRLAEFGFSKDKIIVFDYDNPTLFLNLEIDVIYISGGNTFATIKRIRDCGFDKCIVKYINSGVTYIGGSAGAHIASKSIAHIVEIDPLPEGVTNFDGLGLFDGILVCHYTEKRRELYEALKSDGKYNVYALTDNDSMVVE